MANSNKTVGAFRRKSGAQVQGERRQSDSSFYEFVMTQAAAGVTYESTAAAKRAFEEATKGESNEQSDITT